MQAPAKNSSLIYNCHKSFRIVLLAGGHCDYEFTLINIGKAGRRSHRGVFSNSNLSYAIVNDLLDCLEPENVNKSDFTLPLVFVGDNAFPMKTNLIKPDSAFHFEFCVVLFWLRWKLWNLLQSVVLHGITT